MVVECFELLCLPAKVMLVSEKSQEDFQSGNKLGKQTTLKNQDFCPIESSIGFNLVLFPLSIRFAGYFKTSDIWKVS